MLRSASLMSSNPVSLIKDLRLSKHQEIQWLEPKNSSIDRVKQPFSQIQSDIERDTGIGPASSPWEGDILPVY